MKPSRLTIIGAVLLAGCHQELIDEEYQPLSVDVVTRTDVNVADGLTMGMFVLGSDGGKYESQSYKNVEWIYSTKWNAESNVLLSSKTGKAVCYSPYASDATDYTKIPVRSGTDFLYSGWVSGFNNANPSISFTMSHAMAKITVYIESDGYGGTGKISNVTLVTNQEVGSSGTMDATTGDITVTDKADNLSLDTDLDLFNTASAEYLVIPQGTASGMKMQITVDGTLYEAEVPSTDLTKGNNYKYTLLVSSSSLTIQSVTAEKWTATSLGNYPLFSSY
jgi:hypothetical protein